AETNRRVNEMGWRAAWTAEELVQAHVAAGRPTDLPAARSERLSWEARLVGQPPTRFVPLDVFDPDEELIALRQLAPARRGADRGRAEDLVQARVEAARVRLRIKQREFLAGRTTLDRFQAAVLSFLEAETLQKPGEETQRQLREAGWWIAWTTEEVVRADFAA